MLSDYKKLNMEFKGGKTYNQLDNKCLPNLIMSVDFVICKT